MTNTLHYWPLGQFCVSNWRIQYKYRMIDFQFEFFREKGRFLIIVCGKKRKTDTIKNRKWDFEVQEGGTLLGLHAPHNVWGDLRCTKSPSALFRDCLLHKKVIRLIRSHHHDTDTGLIKLARKAM